MTRADCKTCSHFRSAPYEARIDGCFHPDHMKVTQKEAFLQEQETPGNHRILNLRGDCAEFEPEAPKRSFFSRIRSA